MNIYIRQQSKDLCKYFDDDEVGLLTKVTKVETYDKDTVIIEAGLVPDYLIVLVEGELALKARDTERVLAKIHEGEMVNECFYFTNQAATYSLSTCQKSILAKVYFTDIDDLCDQSPLFAAKLHAAMNDSLCLKIIRLTHKG